LFGKMNQNIILAGTRFEPSSRRYTGNVRTITTTSDLVIILGGFKYILSWSKEVINQVRTKNQHQRGSNPRWLGNKLTDTPLKPRACLCYNAKHKTIKGDIGFGPEWLTMVTTLDHGPSHSRPHWFKPST
jgi:hypothetical protein